jgi:hypothetical protein
MARRATQPATDRGPLVVETGGQAPPPTVPTSVTPDPAWTDSEGILPHKVIVEQNPVRGYRLQLRWWKPSPIPKQKGQWRKESLKVTLGDLVAERVKQDLTPRRALEEAKEWARAKARAKVEQLKAGTEGAPASAAAPTRPLTLGETAAVITDRDTGRYHAKKPHQREVLKSRAVAPPVLGAGTPWAAIDDAMLTTVWRRKIQAAEGKSTRDGRPVDGLRPAEIVIRDLLAIANWLRSKAPAAHRIPLTACVAPLHWRDELRKDWMEIRGRTELPKPRRPRHTNDETQRIRRAARGVDPRLWLLLEVGAELRAGQVERCRRSHLSLDGDGQLEVPGSGRKGGAVVLFTAGQRAAVDACLGYADPSAGYLRKLEAAYVAGEIPDYPLFPGGQLAESRTAGDPHAVVERHAAARPITRDTMMELFHLAEDAADPPVPRVKGRAFYGGRRSGVDEFKKRRGSREALEQFGGWSDSTIPDQIYADEEAQYAREEARDIRARVRGEVPDTPSAPAPAPPQEEQHG